MQTNKALINNMAEGNLFSQLLRFALPLMLANMLQSLYGTVDMIIVGQYIGANGISAISVGGELLHIFTNISMGLSMGAQILIAQHVGARDHEGIKKSIGTIFTVMMGLSAAFLIVGVFSHRSLVVLLNTPAEAFEQTDDYVTICCLGMPFIYGYSCVSSVLRGMGDSKRPLVFVAISSVVNILLDLLLVGKLDLEAAGAAAATVVSQAIAVIFAIIYLYRNRARFVFDFKRSSFRVDREKLIALLKVGVPLAIQHTAINFSMLYMNSQINAYGVAASAVNGVGNRIQNLANIIITSINGAGGTVIGQNLGAGRQDRAKKTVYIAFVLCMGLFAINVTVCLLFPKQLFGLFTADAMVLDMAPSYMRIQIWGFLGGALVGAFGTMITGSGFSTLSLCVGLIDGVIARIGIGLFAANVLGLGLEGLFYGHALARVVSATLEIAYFLSGKWKTRKLLVNSGISEKTEE